jgi:ATP-binding cassette subfamily B protein
LRGVGRWRLAALALGAALGAAGVLAEAVLFRALLSDGSDAPGLVAALVALAVVLLGLDTVLTTQVTGIGRRLEIELRGALLRRLPRLPDRYLRSRPLSDLTERAHRLHRLRELPALAAEMVRLSTYLVLLPVMIGLVDPASALPAALCATVATAVGFLLLPAQAERDLRLRSHVGAVTRFYLDALLGVAAIRAHSGESAVEGEHARMLGPWAAAVRAVHCTAITAELIQGGLSLVFVTWLLATASVRVADPGTFLLLAYWAVGLPALGAQLGALARRYPAYRSATLRIIEPFATPPEQPTAAATPLASPPARADNCSPFREQTYESVSVSIIL